LDSLSDRKLYRRDAAVWGRKRNRVEDYIDALSFTVATLTITGLLDFPIKPPGGKILSVFITVDYIFGLATHAFLQARRRTDEASTFGMDIRYVVTSLAEGSVEQLRYTLCARGRTENLIVKRRSVSVQPILIQFVLDTPFPGHENCRVQSWSLIQVSSAGIATS